MLASPVAILTVWAVTRLLIALAGLEHLPYPRNDVLYNDVEVYTSWSDRIAGGAYPANDPMWQYPPLAGLVFWLPRFTPMGTYVGFVWLALFADLGIQLVLLVDARRRDRTGGAWWWACTALFVGPIMLGRFDVVPTLFAVAAVAAATRAPVRAGIWSAVGAMLKVWPVLVLLAVPRRRLPAALAAFAGTAAVLLLALRWWRPGSMSFLSFQAERGLQVESVAALPYLVSNAAGGFVSRAYQFGAMEITNPGARSIATTVSLAGIAVLLVLGLQRLLGRLERVPAVDVAVVALLVSMTTSRVLSPQYTVWVLGVGALAFADRRSRVRPAVMLVAVAAVVTQPLYPLWYGDLLQGEWYAVIAQGVRVGCVVLATLWAGYRVMLRPGRYPPRRDARAGADQAAARAPVTAA